LDRLARAKKKKGSRAQKKIWCLQAKRIKVKVGQRGGKIVPSVGLTRFAFGGPKAIRGGELIVTFKKSGSAFDAIS